MDYLRERVRYRVLTGSDDEEFFIRVSAALDDGYELYGSPSVTSDGGRTLVAQAVVLPAYAAGRYKAQPVVEPEPADPA